MTLVAHAIVEAPPRRAERPGLRGRPLRWCDADGLGVWTTECEDGVTLDRADALEHHRVVEAICDAQPCLPVRFGTAFADSDSARAALRPKLADLRTALARVAGKTELSLTLLWKTRPSAAPAADAAGPGRRFMEERRAEQRARDAARDRANAMVARLVEGLAVDQSLVWHEICTSPDVAVSLAVLVLSERAADRKAELARLAAAFDDVTAAVNGPWPPYSFAGLG